MIEFGFLEKNFLNEKKKFLRKISKAGVTQNFLALEIKILSKIPHFRVIFFILKRGFPVQGQGKFCKLRISERLVWS